MGVVLPGVREGLDTVDEEELVRRTAGGDRRAFDEFVPADVAVARRATASPVRRR
jgi:hypothetical protein